MSRLAIKPADFGTQTLWIALGNDEKDRHLDYAHPGDMLLAFDPYNVLSKEWLALPKAIRNASNPFLYKHARFLASRAANVFPDGFCVCCSDRAVAEAILGGLIPAGKVTNCNLVPNVILGKYSFISRLIYNACAARRTSRYNQSETFRVRHTQTEPRTERLLRELAVPAGGPDPGPALVRPWTVPYGDGGFLDLPN